MLSSSVQVYDERWVPALVVAAGVAGYEDGAGRLLWGWVGDGVGPARGATLAPFWPSGCGFDAGEQ